MVSARLDPVAWQDRRARLAVAAVFFTNGALFAALLPRYPEIKADLAMSNTLFGLAVAAFSGGAFLAGVTAGALIRRFTSARVGVAGTLGIATFVFLAGLAPSGGWFAAALFVATRLFWRYAVASYTSASS